MKITREFIKENCTKNLGWNRKQFTALGLPWPPVKGWIDTVVGNEISPENKRIFIKSGRIPSKITEKKSETKILRAKNSPGKRLKKKKLKKKKPSKKDNSDWWIKYNAYLKSPEWKFLREVLFRMRGRKCEKCESTNILQIHHLTYKNVFNEKYEDLQILCLSCHKEVHKKEFTSDTVPSSQNQQDSPPKALSSTF